MDSASTLEVVDLLGQGTACLVWSTPLVADVTHPLAYVDLMGGRKPHLLESVVNNLGGEMRVSYAASTKFYLEDKAAGRPWLTRLSFPVYVIERLEHRDCVAGSRLVTLFRYHHGYFDGKEREFRGFACVEQWDAESDPADPALDQPPVRTVTWFHTGAWLERERLELALAKEYYRADADAPLLVDTVLPPGLSIREQQEATRALRGQMLRQEIYGEDGTPEHLHPYSTSERSYAVRVLQRREASACAVFFVHASDSVDLHYERRPDDPRTQQELVMDVDEFGNVTRSVTLAYPRRTAEQPEQARLWATVTELSFANHPGEPDWYRIGVHIATVVSELTGLSIAGRRLASAEELRLALAASSEIPYEATAQGSDVQRRMVHHERVAYYRDNLTDRLPFGTIESLALVYETYRQAFTSGLVGTVYGNRVTDDLLRDPAGYTDEDGAWWARSGRTVPEPSRFYLPAEWIDPFGNHHVFRHDSYSLLVLETEDPLGNRTTAGARAPEGRITQSGLDYRVLAPWLMSDANRNRTAIEFDELGMVVKIAVMDKEGSVQGDTLQDPTTRLEYDLHSYKSSGGQQPAYVRTLARERHGSANPRWQESYSYSDGSGREVMSKVQAEPGPVPVLDADGHLVRNPDGTPKTRDVASRWVGTGRIVFDNKGNTVKKYEPFFADTNQFEREQELVEWGVTPILRYDPLGRLVRTDQPDGTYSRVVFDAWKQETWDENDSVVGTTWLARMQGGSAVEQRAATLALAHAGTASIVYLDALGRIFLTIADNGSAGRYETRLELDVVGNQLSLTDSRGLRSIVQTFDMLRRKIHDMTADAGESRLLPDAADKPLVSWGARGHIHRRRYDELQRSTHLFVRDAAGDERLVERTVHGEKHPGAEDLNLRGLPHQTYDGAGVLLNDRYDSDGKVLEISRRVGRNVRAQADWSPLAELVTVGEIEAAASPLLEEEAFTIATEYDALKRIISRTTPDGSETRPSYNEANLLERIEVRLRGAAEWTVFIVNVDYNARGQRERVEHGNGTICDYQYDSQTFRLVVQRTTRTQDGRVLQDLRYQHDAVGNVVQISDAVRFGNAEVSADGLYEYDPIYQLVKAEGREHPGQQPTDEDAVVLRLDHPNDMQALRRYQESYVYDPVGNIEQIVHQPVGAGPPGWTRRYEYASDGNRLLRTSLPGDLPGAFSASYEHDDHGRVWISS